MKLKKEAPPPSRRVFPIAPSGGHHLYEEFTRLARDWAGLKYLNLPLQS